MRWCSLALLLAGCHAALDRPIDPGDAAAPDLGDDLAPGPVVLDLLGGWDFTYDAEATSDPTATILGNTSDEIIVTFDGSGGCGCSARHRVFAMPRQMPCDTTVMSFDWMVGDVLGIQRSTALRVDFNPAGDHYRGNAGVFVGSTWNGASACAWDLPNNLFPSMPRMQRGHNEIPLGSLTPTVDGSCNPGGTFDHIDVHVGGYTCSGTVTADLANLSFR